MPQLGNRPASSDNRQGAEHRTDQRGVGRAEQGGARASDDRAGGVGCLREHRQETRRATAHIIGREKLTTVRRMATLMASLMPRVPTAMKPSQNHLRQPKKSQAHSKHERDDDRKRAFAFDIAGGEQQA